MSLVLACSFANAQSCLDPWIQGEVFPHSVSGFGSAIGWDPDGAGPLEERLIVSDFVLIPAAPTCHGVAWWDGRTWQPMGQPTETPRSLAVIAGELYGGDNRWNGSSWEQLGEGLFDVVALADWNGSPVAVARTSWTSSTRSIFRWNGSEWESLALTDATDSTDKKFALTTFEGDLIAVGPWTTFDGQAIQSVARFDGAMWSAIGDGLSSGRAQTASVIAGELYIGGSFTLANPALACSVAKWDGNAWSKYGPVGISPIGFAERAAKPLVLAPSCADGCSTVDSVFQLQGGQWAASTSDGPKGDVRALAKVGDSIVAVGQFSCASAGPGMGNKADVAVLVGSEWMSLTAGLNGGVYAAVRSGSDLICGGNFTQTSGISAARIARWDGREWSVMGSGFNVGVSALAEFNGSVYAGGAFTRSGSSNVLYAAVWNGTQWQNAGNSGFNGAVNFLAAGPDRLYASGNFTHAGGLRVDGMAQLVGGKWYSIAGRLSGGGRIAVHQGSLFSTGVVSTTSGLMSGIARWDGTQWSSIAPQLSGTVSEMFSDGESLWIQGSFKIAPADPTTRCARWNGSSWQTFAALSTLIGRFVMHEGSLYFADRAMISRWDGASWNVVATRPGVGSSDAIGSAVSFGGEIVVAGQSISMLSSTQVFDPIFDRWNESGVPGLLEQPQAAVIAAGDDVSFRVAVVSGYEAFGGVRYQWRRNGTELMDGTSIGGGVVSGAQASELEVASAGREDSGFYDCRIFTDCGESFSEAARLLVGGACEADFNNDGLVDDADFGVFVLAYNILDCAATEMPLGCPADLNLDAVVDDADFSLFVTKYNEMICP